MTAIIESIAQTPQEFVPPHGPFTLRENAPSLMADLDAYEAELRALLSEVGEFRERYTQVAALDLMYPKAEESMKTALAGVDRFPATRMALFPPGSAGRQAAGSLYHAVNLGIPDLLHSRRIAHQAAQKAHARQQEEQAAQEEAERQEAARIRALLERYPQK